MMGVKTFITLVVISVIVAVRISRTIIRKLQTKCCLYCSCRECCSNGTDVEPACDPEDTRPLVCMEEAK